jgi:hypothetical protein
MDVKVPLQHFDLALNMFLLKFTPFFSCWTNVRHCLQDIFEAPMEAPHCHQREHNLRFG